MVETFLTSPFLMKVILPFALIFIVVYAILEKAKILGEDKKGIDVIVALAVALIAVSVAYPSDFLGKIIPFFAVSVIIVLVILILFAFSDGSSPYALPGGIKTGIMVIFGIALLIAVIWATGAWPYLHKEAYTKEGSSILANVVFLIIIGAVIAVAYAAGGSGGSSGKKDKK